MSRHTKENAKTRCGGVDAERPRRVTAGVRQREDSFFLAGRQLAMIALREDTTGRARLPTVTLPTVVQTIARRVRYDGAALPRAPVLRFLADLVHVAQSEL